jgi:hypothetical protein
VPAKKRDVRICITYQCRVDVTAVHLYHLITLTYPLMSCYHRRESAFSFIPHSTAAVTREDCQPQQRNKHSLHPSQQPPSPQNFVLVFLKRCKNITCQFYNLINQLLLISIKAIVVAPLQTFFSRMSFSFSSQVPFSYYKSIVWSLLLISDVDLLCLVFVFSTRFPRPPFLFIGTTIDTIRE